MRIQPIGRSQRREPKKEQRFFWRSAYFRRGCPARAVW